MPVEHSKHSLRSFRFVVAVVEEDSKPFYGEVVLEVQGFVDRLNGVQLDVAEELHAAGGDVRLVEAIIDYDTKWRVKRKFNKKKIYLKLFNCLPSILVEVSPTPSPLAMAVVGCSHCL